MAVNHGLSVATAAVRLVVAAPFVSVIMTFVALVVTQILGMHRNNTH
jgi:hypothetical protein